MGFGLSDAGLSIKRLADIQPEIEDALRGVFGNSVRLDPASRWGQVVGIIAEREALVWELLEYVLAAGDPRSAGGVQLDRLYGLLRLPRLGPKPSTVTPTLTGTPGTTIPLGSAATVTGSTARFALLAPVVIPDSGSAPGLFACTVDGPTPCLAGALATIATPVSGWASITNPLDAALGRNLETDPAYRARSARALLTIATSSSPGMVSAALRVPDVLEVLLIENASGGVDADGRPPNAIELVVRGGTDDAIRAVVWATKPSGNPAVGNVGGSIVDLRGDTQPIAFSRPTEVPIYVDATLTVGRTFPADGLTQVQGAILAFGAGLPMATAVAPFPIEQIIETPGILELDLRIGRAQGVLSGAPIKIARTEIATFDSSRLTLRRAA